MSRWKVECWNGCDEGYIEPIDEWQSDVCSICKGKGYLVVTELNDDNCEEAIPVADEP